MGYRWDAMLLSQKRCRLFSSITQNNTLISKSSPAPPPPPTPPRQSRAAAGRSSLGNSSLSLCLSHADLNFSSGSIHLSLIEVTVRIALVSYRFDETVVSPYSNV